MKRYVIAIATLALAAGGVANARPVTNLYGKIDLGYGIGNDGIYEGSEGRESKFQQWGNSKTTSVWGIVGGENLSNDYKVYFRLESAFDPSTGEGRDRHFSEAAFVGVKGNFGSLQMGRQDTVSKNIMGEFDVSGAPGLTSSLGNAGISGDAQRLGIDTYSTVDSSLVYLSPDFSGLSLQAGFVSKNDDIAGASAVPFGLASSKNIYTLGVNYHIGQLSVGAVYESKPFDLTGLSISSSWGVGAKYDFESFLITASYFDNHLDTDGKGFSLGVSVPINAFVLGAQVAYNTDATGITGEDVKPFAWELYGTYNFSYRTQLYAQYGGMNKDGKDFNAAARQHSAAFGVIFAF